MGIETPKIHTPEEIAEIEKTQKRVEKLRESDDEYTDSTKRLAEEEGRFRQDLKEFGVSEKENRQKLADKYSDAHLEKLEAERRSLTDALTELGNRRALEQSLKMILSLGIRSGKDCSLLMIDADYFKRINDEFGHEIGDFVLKRLADKIKQNIRKSDAAFRYGGEEFSVILPETSLSGAQIVAEKIRKAVEQSVFEFLDKNKKISIKNTISLGLAGTEQLSRWKEKSGKKVSVSPEETELIIGEMLKKADQALYESKDAGRNKASVFTEK